MKITLLISSSLAAVAFAVPVPQFTDHWTGFFGPDPGYYSYGNVVNPYYPPQGPLHPGQQDQLPPLGPPLAMPPYIGPYHDPGAPIAPSPPFPPVPAPGPLDNPIGRTLPASLPPYPGSPAPVSNLSPASAPAQTKHPKPVSEKPRDKKRLSGKLAPEFDDTPAPVLASKPVVKTEESRGDDFDKDAIRYRVNVGGIQKGGGGGTTNFHVFTDENGTKRFSDELDDETEKYITENMIPKLGGRRRGGNRSGVWSVFGGK